MHEGMLLTKSLSNQWLTQSRHGIGLLSSDGEWLEVNPALCRLTGRPQETWSGVTLRDLLHPEQDWSSVQQALEGNTAEERPIIRFSHPDGSDIWFEISAHPFIDEGSACSYTLVQLYESAELIAVKKSLEWTKEQCRLISQHSQDLFYVSKENGQVQFISNPVQKLLGYTPEELVGRSDALLFHEDDYDSLLHSDQSEEAELKQIRMLTKDGRVLWFEANARDIADRTGERLFLFTGREISARKHQEDMVAEAERIVSMGSWEWDLEAELFSFTRHLQHIYEHMEQHRVGETISDINSLVMPSDLDRFQAALEETLAGKVLSFECRIPGKDGNPCYLHIRGNTLFSPEGKPLRINGTVQDITERKLIENKLLETVERYTSLKKYNHDAIISLSLDGTVINANPVAQQLTGYPVSELIGTNFSRFSGKDKLQSFLSGSYVDDIADNPIDHIQHRDGHSIEVLTTLAPIIIHEEKVGFYLIVKDITEQKKLMIEKEAAESTTKAKSEFLATISHEIRTPMNGVIGMTDLLAESGNWNEEQQAYLTIIRKSGDTLLALINDILDFSKMDSGKTDLSEEPFDIRGCLGEVKDILSTKAREKGIELQLQCSPAVPFLLIGDEKRVKQVLTNLIHNAIKFTNEGSVRIDVEKQKDLGRSVELKIVVKDTGVGVPHGQEELLFEPFHQIVSRSAPSQEGSGLGLAICKKLVELMGGRIWIEHGRDQGTTFVFTILLQKAASHSDGHDLDRMSAAVRNQRELRILIAEDNKINQLVLRTMLEKLGHKVHVVDRGDEAVEQTHAGSFDLIFMDVQMPGMNGIEATQAIRKKLSGHKQPIIVAVTANALKGDREKCLEAGMDDYMSKPIHNRMVQEMIAAYL